MSYNNIQEDLGVQLQEDHKDMLRRLMDQSRGVIPEAQIEELLRVKEYDMARADDALSAMIKKRRWDLRTEYVKSLVCGKFSDLQVENAMKATDYHIEKARKLMYSEIQEAVPPLSMTITVKTAGYGTVISLEAEPTDTVEILKFRIEDNVGTPPNEQRLVFSGNHLENDRTLGAYNLQPGSQIFMLLRLRGG